MFSTSQSVLLVIDVQGNLAYKMHDKENLFRNIQGIIKAAYHLKIPIIYTEQAPEKIGQTVPEIANELMGHKPVVKTTFGCCGEPNFIDHLKSLKRNQIIVTGIETHVCVYQTVRNLLDLKYQVEVVGDAVSSRTQTNKRFALERMREKGADITCTEMLVTELLQTAEHPKFKDVLNLIR